MPESAAIVDALTAVFGRPQAMRFTEGGRQMEWGTFVQWSRAVRASMGKKPGKPLKESR